MSDWIDGWLVEAPMPLRCVVQYGYSRPPQLAEGRDLLTYQETQALLAEAHAVVCHGGPATIMDCRRAGLVPFVVPRQHALGEHVDDHQVLFTKRVAAAGVIRLVEDQSTLHRLLTAELMAPRSGTWRPAVGDSSAVAVDAIARSISLMGPRRRRLCKKSSL
jgi:UDP-N-acetylglucosamine transferase subunit ALG13